MVSMLSFAVSSVMGGVIGYGTNELAIWMLFHPRTPRFLFGHQLPMTPGIIPKNKARIAEGIALMVSSKLINAEALGETLLSKDMMNRVRQKTHDFIAARQSDIRPLIEVLGSTFGADVVKSVKSATLNGIDNKVAEKMTDPELAGAITQKIMEAVKEKVSGSIALSIGLSIFAGTLEKNVSEMVSKMLAEQGSAMVSQMIHTEADKLLATPLSNLLAGHDDVLARIEDGVVDTYQRLVKDKLPEMLATVDIKTIVKQRIMDMDVMALETMIREICNKELRMIVWIGAVLGVFLGCANVYVLDLLKLM